MKNPQDTSHNWKLFVKKSFLARENWDLQAIWDQRLELVNERENT